MEQKVLCDFLLTELQRNIKIKPDKNESRSGRGRQKMEDHIMELEVLRKDMVAAMKAKDKVTKERAENSKRTDRHLPGRPYRPERRVSGKI